MNRSNEFHSRIISDARLLQGILGLRGMAAFAIVLFHLVRLTGIHVPVEFRFIENNFGAAVHLFFVLSAFSLMYSAEHTMYRPTWVKEYAIKRFFRIAPLFYTVLAFMVIWMIGHAIKSDSALPDMSIILINVFFVYGFFPDPAVGLVQAGWTVGVEMIFYVLFPILLMVIKTRKEALILLLVTVLISYASRNVFHAEYLKFGAGSNWDWSYFAFLPNFFYFAVGVYAYRLEQSQKASGKPLHVLVPLIALLAIGNLFHTHFDWILQALGFGALCIWQSTKPSFWCANKFFEYLGERSFSIYLLHPLVIYFSMGYIVKLYAMLEPDMGSYAYFICALVVMAEVLVMAELTYRAIEVPGIKFGRNLIEIMRGKVSLA